MRMRPKLLLAFFAIAVIAAISAGIAIFSLFQIQEDLSNTTRCVSAIIDAQSRNADYVQSFRSILETLRNAPDEATIQRTEKERKAILQDAEATFRVKQHLKLLNDLARERLRYLVAKNTMEELKEKLSEELGSLVRYLGTVVDDAEFHVALALQQASEEMSQSIEKNRTETLRGTRTISEAMAQTLAIIPLTLQIKADGYEMSAEVKKVLLTRDPAMVELGRQRLTTILGRSRDRLSALPKEVTQEELREAIEALGYVIEQTLPTKGELLQQQAKTQNLSQAIGRIMAEYPEETKVFSGIHSTILRASKMADLDRVGTQFASLLEKLPPDPVVQELREKFTSLLTHRREEILLLDRLHTFQTLVDSALETLARTAEQLVDDAQFEATMHAEAAIQELDRQVTTGSATLASRTCTMVDLVEKTLPAIKAALTIKAVGYELDATFKHALAMEDLDLLAYTRSQIEPLVATARTFFTQLPDRQTIEEVRTRFSRASTACRTALQNRMEMIRAERCLAKVIRDVDSSLRELEKEFLREAKYVQHDSQRRFEQTRMLVGWWRWLQMALGIGAVLAAILIAHLLTRSFVVPILRVVEMANAIADGKMPPQLGIAAHGEIRDLEAAFSRMIENTRAIVAQAQTLAQGNYTVTIRPRSSEDELSHALIRMTESLRSFDEQSRRENWFKTGLAELGSAMRGEQDIYVLCNNVLSFLVQYLEANVGTLFIQRTENLYGMAASYAHTYRENYKHEFSVGEGLIGQVILEKKPIVSKVPKNYAPIASSIGEAIPESVLIFPLIHSDVVMGVLELGAFHIFPRKAIEFLEQAGPAVALALHAAQRRAEVNRLLLETQQQAKILAEQQEKLQETNAALEERTELLEKQSLELKEQREELEQTNTELEERTELLEKQSIELRKQREELERTNVELEERTELLEKQKREIDQKNAELERARQELEKKAEDLALASKYKSEFLANMSHELRTPLNSLLILSRLLMENKEGNLTEKQVGFAKTIHNAGSDLLNLINDILDLSKVEAGKLQFDISDVYIDEICNAMERIFKPIAADKGISFEVKKEAGIPASIRTDGLRIQQVIKNLLSNAFKFTHEGSVTLRVYPPSPAENPPPYAAVAFAVIDTGIGIPKDKFELIFQAFQQADGTTSRKYGGTGLGLSISRELALHLGGDIRLESEVGKGSTFTLYLPKVAELSSEGLKRAASQAQKTQETKTMVPPAVLTKPAEPSPAILAASHAQIPPPAVVAPPPVESKPEKKENLISISDDRDHFDSTKKSLLIIEDDPKFAQVLIDLAHEKGWQCLAAPDGVRGLELAEKYQPSGIILDIMLPGMDGWSVMQRLKDSPKTRHIPVHFMSALEQDYHALQMGAIGYLTKPVSVEQIDEALKRIEHILARSVKKLLIIEDNLEEAKSIVHLLASNDVQTTIAESGKKAIAKINQETFDCIILDIGLADMSGFEILETLRKTHRDTHIPVIIHTGRDLTEEEETRLHQYAESIIIKGAHSPERLLDETTLFLHLVESKLPEEQRRMIKRAHDQEATLAGKKILIVDDDMRNAFSLASAFEDVHIEPLMAANGKKALEILEANPNIDLVLMDVMMPEMDGYETTRRIRQNPRFKKLPIIALTAKAMKGDREKCIEAGANDYLPKPVDLDRLFSVLRVWLYH